MRTVVLGAWILCAISWYGCHKPSNLTEAFTKLEGRWVAQDGDGQYIEVWKPGTAENVFAEGYAFTLKGADSSLHETIAIAATDSGIFYQATSGSQNNGSTIGFKLMQMKNDNIMSFENPAHDFPKKIVYTFKDHNTLHVEVGAGEQKFELNFNRMLQ